MDRVYITPLGMSYGSLYSGIVLTKPDTVIIITSETASVNIHTALEAALKLHPNFGVETYFLADPFAGFAEGRELAKTLASALQAGGEKNDYTVCLTGGTTALQDAVKCVADLLNAREVALVDRRPVIEQRANPLVIGELIEVPQLSQKEPSCQ